MCMCMYGYKLGSADHAQVHKHVLISLESIVGIDVPSKIRVHKRVLGTLKIMLVIVSSRVHRIKWRYILNQ